MQTGERVVFRSPNYLFFFTVLNIVIQVYCSLTLLKVYSVQTSLPQIMTYFYAIFGMVFTLIVRLKKREVTRKLLNSVFASCISDSYAPNVIMYCVIFALAVILTTCLYITLSLLPVQIIEFTSLFIALSFWVVMAGYSIDCQVICICSMLDMSLEALNRVLATATVTRRKLCEFKRLHSKFVRLTRNCNRIYGLDLFMTLSCSSLITFVTINDLIYYITLPYFEDWGMYLPLRLMSTVYYIIKLISVSTKMCWLCYRMAALGKQVT